MATTIATITPSPAAVTDLETAEVRKEDQEMINEFGRLNKKIAERRAEIKQVTLDSFLYMSTL
jgi:hypothetical protein